MYNGKNPSALRSQQWITEALLKLMKTKDFQTITVKEICMEADLTRQTFYQFFASKEDVIRFALSKYYVVYEEELLKNEQVNLKTLATSFFHFFKKHKDFICLLISNRLDYLLTEQFSLVLPRIMKLCVNDENSLISNPHINCFVVGGLSAMIIDWLKSDETTSEEELTELFLRLFEG